MKAPLYCQNPQDPINRNLFEKYLSIDGIFRIKKPTGIPFLIIQEGRLGMAGEGWPKVHPVFVDFLSGASNHRRMQGGGVGQAVAKAVGLQKRRDLNIWDATAGLGRDSFVLASLGAHVWMFERNPLVQLLLMDGLAQLKLSSSEDIIEIDERLNFIQGDFLTTDAPNPDVIYLDPMFPERSKSAKVKKDMKLFHEVVGSDADADDFLAPAIERATYRVVVKRSKNAPLLAGKEPSTSLVGKSSRFDIYTKKAIV